MHSLVDCIWIDQMFVCTMHDLFDYSWIIKNKFALSTEYTTCEKLLSM